MRVLIILASLLFGAVAYGSPVECQAIVPSMINEQIAQGFIPVVGQRENGVSVLVFQNSFGEFRYLVLVHEARVEVAAALRDDPDVESVWTPCQIRGQRFLLGKLMQVRQSAEL